MSISFIEIFHEHYCLILLLIFSYSELILLHGTVRWIHNFRGNMIYASLFCNDFCKKFICVAIHLVHILIKSRRDGLLCGPGVGVSFYIFGYKRTAKIFKTPPIHIFNIFENHTHSYIYFR